MKKTRLPMLLVIIMCFAVINAFAQSPRMQLFEYFDNVSIPIAYNSATGNAHFDSLANANAAKVTFIKYHVAWGAETGTDPMNLHNPAQIQTRVTYYNVFGDPHLIQDGGVAADATFVGHPINVTQYPVNHRDSTTSPFTITVTHMLNTANDSIKCHVVIKKTGVAPGGLVAHVVVIEKLVHFLVAPNISGDVNFRNVVKRMLPTDAGSALPAMAIGDSVVLDLNWKLANVYSTGQLGVVSFVQGQDSTNREVYQAGYSAPIPQANNASILAVNGASLFSCDSIMTTAVLRNDGTAPLTSCTINYRIDNTTPVTIPWTGSLAPGASANVSVPKFYSGGFHMLNVYSTNPNGSSDNDHTLDSVAVYFSNKSGPQTVPLSEGFQTSSPPTGWGVTTKNLSKTWKQGTVGGFGTSSKSARLNWYNIPAGDTDNLYMPVLDLTTNTTPLRLAFSVAYVKYDASSDDELQVRVSTNCGNSWSVVYAKVGAALATAVENTNIFVPGAGEWRYELIDISSYNGQSNVMIQFHGISAFGNDLYIDDINLRDATAVTSPEMAVEFTVYPAPASDVLNVRYTSITGQRATMCLIDMLGKTVLTYEYVNSQQGSNEAQLSVGSLPSGIYLLKVQNGAETMTKKIEVRR